MGRRPNPVVSEYFFRGAKIEDASNRYAHTCRRCGELFAKGRVEYLMQHLLKSCPNITDSDRATILQQLQRSAGARPATKASQRRTNGLTGFPTDNGLPSTLERQQSALDTLAEVSRHHLDYSVQRQLPSSDGQVNVSDQDLAEQALWAQLNQHGIDFNAQPDPEYHLNDGQYTSDVMHGLSAAAPSRGFTSGENGYPQSYAQLDPELDSETAARIASQLTQATYSGPETQSAVDGQIPAMSLDSQLPSANFVPYDFDKTYINDAGSNRNKPRSKFTESRRREVQEIRKRGACLRCRMLKKPCSEGTPCRTCATVDIARLWKGKCLRTKLADEYAAWGAQFYQGLWMRQIADAQGEEVSISLIELEVHILDQRESPVDPLRLPVTAQSDSMFLQAPHDTPIMTISIDDTDHALDELIKYVMLPDNLAKAINIESNPLIRTTLSEVLDICSTSQEVRKTGEVQDEAQNAETARPSFAIDTSVSSQLLSNALQLWMLSLLVTSWDLMPSDGTDLITLRLNVKPGATTSPDFVASLTTANHERLKLQLQVLMERRAATLGKSVLSDVERHLLQRQQVSGYTTLLAAAVVLAAIERITDFYYSIDVRMEAATQQPEATLPFSWPLTVSPFALWSQGPPFANLLLMLLRIRGLPPRVFEDECGILAVLNDRAESMSKINGNVSEAHLRAHDDHRRFALMQWLQKCNVKAIDVQKWLSQEGSWDGKFVAGLLIEDVTDDKTMI